MIGDTQCLRRRHADGRTKFGEIARIGGEFPRARLPHRVPGELVRVILQLRGAARGGDQHAVILALFIGNDRLLGPLLGVMFAAHMMGQRAATARTFQRHQLNAAPCQYPAHGAVDLRTERALHAARHDGDALLHHRRLGEMCRLRSLGCAERPMRAMAPSRPGMIMTMGAPIFASNSPMRTKLGRVITLAMVQRRMRSPSGR